MKTRKESVCGSKDGSALVMAMSVAVVVAVATLSLMTFADYQMGAVQRAREDNVAMSIAEAGANQAFALVKANFANKDNASLFPATSYNGGTFDATVTTVNTNRAQIKSVGISGVTTSTVIVDIQNAGAGDSTGGTSGDTTSPWGHSVFVNGYITHNGSGTALGSVRCNHYLTCNGSMNWGSTTNLCNVSCSQYFSGNGSITIHGTVTAPTITVNGSDNIDTKAIASVPLLAFPALDLTPYYNLAVANSQVYNGTSYNGTQNFGTIPGGVRWYNGALSFNGSSSWGGCLIATGAISFNGSFSNTKVGDLPAIVSRDSTVSCNGSHTVRGLVYSAGNLTWNGSGTINGSILVGGNLTFNGSYGTLSYEYSYPSTSTGGTGGSGSTNAVVGITAWQK